MNIYASKSLGEKLENEVNKQATGPTGSISLCCSFRRIRCGSYFLCPGYGSIILFGLPSVERAGMVSGWEAYTPDALLNRVLSNSRVHSISNLPLA